MVWYNLSRQPDMLKHKKNVQLSKPRCNASWRRRRKLTRNVKKVAYDSKQKALSDKAAALRAKDVEPKALREARTKAARKSRSDAMRSTVRLGREPSLSATL